MHLSQQCINPIFQHLNPTLPSDRPEAENTHTEGGHDGGGLHCTLPLAFSASRRCRLASSSAICSATATACTFRSASTSPATDATKLLYSLHSVTTAIRSVLQGSDACQLVDIAPVIVVDKDSLLNLGRMSLSVYPSFSVSAWMR